MAAEWAVSSRESSSGASATGSVTARFSARGAVSGEASEALEFFVGNLSDPQPYYPPSTAPLTPD